MSVKPPKLDQELPEEDWISGLSSQNDYVCASLFSGELSIYKSNKKIISSKISQKSLKSIKI